MTTKEQEVTKYFEEIEEYLKIAESMPAQRIRFDPLLFMIWRIKDATAKSIEM